MPVVSCLKFLPCQFFFIFCVVLAFVVPRQVCAFENYEHRHLGDLALRIAVDYAQVRKEKDPIAYWQKSFDERCEALEFAVRQFYRDAQGHTCPSVAPDAPSYGDLVSLVDNFPYPHKLFDAAHETLSDGIPDSFEELNQYMLAEGSDRFTVNLAKASSNNELHFQVAAINAMVTLHREAIALARNDKPFAALASNALADHFLHDFFSPGHITVNRDNSHDAIALGMHDTVNRIGANFLIYSEKWERDLLPIFDFIASHHVVERGAYSFDIKGKGPTVQETLVFLDEFRHDHSAIYLYGDDRLSQNPRQQLFMLLVAVRGLLDLLEPCDGDLCNTNSLNEYLWYEFDDTKREKMPKAGIPYGEYEIDAALLSEASNIFILSLGGEAPLSEFGSSRLFIAAELVPLSIIGASDFLRKHTTNRPTMDCPVFSACNIAPALGVTYLRDEKFNAFGPSLRLIKAFPKVDIQVSGYYQYLTYDLPQDKRKSTYGLRLDTGFSLYTAFIGLGKGYFVQDSGQLKSDLVVTFGMALGLPLSRIGFNH